MKINYWLVTGVIFLWLVFAFVVPCLLGGYSSSGPWGDTFGAFSALINGIGFIAVVATLRMQADTFKLQVNENKFKFLYDHLSNLEHNLESFAFDGQPAGAHSILRV